MSEVDLPGLITALVDARPLGRGVQMPFELSLNDAVEVLRALAATLLGAGDRVVGWKIGTIPTSDGLQKFAGPVFASSLEEVRLSSLASPRVEIELVASLAQSLNGLAFEPEGWRLGAEVIDNHDPAGEVSLAWAVADWGFHAAAAYGAPCTTPKLADQTSLSVRDPQGSWATQAEWSIESSRLLDVLQHYAPLTARECRPGDLVWTGSVCPPIPLVSPGPYDFRLEHWGSVRLEVV